MVSCTHMCVGPLLSTVSVIWSNRLHVNYNSRLRAMNEKYPIQNQTTEDMCPAVKEMQEEIEKIKMASGAMLLVREMKPHILSNICLDFQGKIPTMPNEDCPHTGQNRSINRKVI